MSFFSKPDIHSVLLVDIASASVGVGLSGVGKQTRPELVFTSRIPFGHRPDFDFAHMERVMLLALRDALGIAFREGTLLLSRKGYPSAINHCVISFTSPWFVAELGSTEDEFVSKVTKYYGERVETFGSGKGLNSATRARLVRQIEDEIIRAFGIKEGINLENFTVAFSKVLEHSFHDIEPALFVDITGHATDILSMKQAAYQSQHSAPHGTLRMKDRELEWNKYWQTFSESVPAEFSSGNIFLTSDDYPASRRLLESALPEARIIPFGSENGFIQDMVIFNDKRGANERLAILLVFSHLFL